MCVSQLAFVSKQCDVLTAAAATDNTINRYRTPVGLTAADVISAMQRDRKIETVCKLIMRRLLSRSSEEVGLYTETITIYPQTALLNHSRHASHITE